MTSIDFDFARYVAQRRGMIEQQTLYGAAYAYRGEYRVRRALIAARPVSIAIEAATRRWKSSAKDDLLSGATLVSDQSDSDLFNSLRSAAKSLGIKLPATYLVDDEDVDARTLGTNAEPVVVIHRSLVAALDRDEKLALAGHLFGHVQNNHVSYSTALFYLRYDAAFFVRWIVQPAILTLQAWSRRAEITCDRAALVASKNVDATCSAIVKLAAGADVDAAAYLAEMPEARTGVGKVAGMFSSYPELPTRIHAVRLFADSVFYRGLSGETGGTPSEQLDQNVADMLSLLR